MAKHHTFDHIYDINAKDPLDISAQKFFELILASESRATANKILDEKVEASQLKDNMSILFTMTKTELGNGKLDEKSLRSAFKVMKTSEVQKVHAILRNKAALN